MNAAALLHLLQFASPALPVGGYSYSQGLEPALEDGIVTDAASAQAWIVRVLHEVVAAWDAPLFWRLLQAYAVRDDVRGYVVDLGDPSGVLVVGLYRARNYAEVRTAWPEQPWRSGLIDSKHSKGSA